jgi:hypothetical protein
MAALVFKYHRQISPEGTITRFATRHAPVEMRVSFFPHFDQEQATACDAPSQAEPTERRNLPAPTTTSVFHSSNA